MPEIIKDIELKDIIPLIDKKWLINGLWQYAGKGGEGETVFREIVEKSDTFLLEPRLVFEMFDAEYSDEQFSLYPDNRKKKTTFHINKKILAKLIKGSINKEDIDKVQPEKAVLLAVTIGDRVKETAEKERRDGRYKEYFLITGFAAALAEALTEYGHQEICRKVGWDKESTIRISPGYPAWTELADQRSFEKLLPLKKIGVQLTETVQLVPEFSTTSMIFRTTY